MSTVKTKKSIRRKKNEFKAPVVLNTGFISLDTLNGSILQTKTGNRTYTGFDAGRIIGIIGKSSTGKSTLAGQLAYGIVKDYVNGKVTVADLEGAWSIQGIQRWSGLYAEDIADTFEILNTIGKKDNDDPERLPLTIQSLYTLVKREYDFKMKHKEDLIELDEWGTPYLEPSVLLIDSFAAARGDGEVDDKEDLGTTTAIMKRAQFIKQFLTSAIPLMEEANIIIIYVNHINDQVSITGLPQAAQLRDMKQSESVPGGKALIFLTNNLLKLTIAKRLREKDGPYNIDGSITQALLVKSRSAETGKAANLIFVPSKGYLNELSTFNALVDAKLIEGTSKHTIPGWEGSFYKKEFLDLIQNDEFRELFNKFALEQLSSNIPINPVKRTEEEILQMALELSSTPSATVLEDAEETVLED